MLKYFLLYFFIGGILFFGKQLIFEKNQVKKKIVISKERVFELKQKSYISDSRIDEALFEKLIEEEVTNEILFKEAFNLKINESDLLVRNWLIRNMKFLLKREDGSPGESVSDEKYFKKALSLGLDKKDKIIRRILISRMKDILAYKRGIFNPSLDEIKKYQLKHLKEFSSPPLYRFEQIFYKTSKKAQKNLRVLNKLGVIDQKSEPFHLGRNIYLSKNEIEQSFGNLFYKNMLGIVENNKWVGPINSSFGYHLVKLNKIINGKVHPFERVKEKIKLLIIEKRKKTVLSEEIDKLFKNYEVVLPLEEV